MGKYRKAIIAPDSLFIQLGDEDELIELVMTMAQEPTVREICNQLNAAPALLDEVTRLKDAIRASIEAHDNNSTGRDVSCMILEDVLLEE